MNITEISLKRPVTVVMFFACLSVIGVMGGSRLPLEFLPDIEFPGLVVFVPYRNSTPEEVERRITRPVEEALATLSGVENMNSESRDDGSQVFLKFKTGEDMAIKGIEARDKVDAIRAALPADIERIQVQKFSASSIPMLQLRISADRELQGSYDMLNRNLKRRIERVNGVSQVNLYGVEKKEIRIELAAARIAQHGVDLRLLAEFLQRANFSISAGDVIEAGKRYYVKPEGRFKTLGEVENLVINPQGLRLKDVADIRYTQPRQTYERHLNQRYAIGLDVFKESGANLVEVSNRVKAEVEAVKQFPEMSGISLVEFQDQATEVRTSLGDLVEAGLIGLILSVVVLFIFLGDWRTTLIVSLSVPLSLVITLAAMYFLGKTINILTLMGLMLAVGMLVDNSVVVNEAIFKSRNEHPHDALAATLAGVKNVGLAVTLGTLTTAIVFLPNIFGAQNEITLYLSHVAVTICISLAASLLVAVTLIPQLTSRLDFSMATGSTWLSRFSDRYARWLDWTYLHRGKTSLFIVLVLFSIAIPVKFVKNQFNEDSSGSRLFLDYNLDNVYTLDKIRESVEMLESWFVAHQDQLEFKSVYSYFDTGRAFTLLVLKDSAERSKSADELKEEIRKSLPKIAIGSPSFEFNRSGGEKLSVQVFGETTDGLRALAADVAGMLKRVPGLADIKLKQGAISLEVRVRVDRDRARLYGLSSQQVAELVAGAMRGAPLRPFRSHDGEIDMVLELRREDRLDLDALDTLPILTPSGARIPLSAVARLSVGDVPGTIQREDRRTAVGIEFATKEGVSAEDAKKNVSTFLAQLEFPLGNSWSFGRGFEEEDEGIQTMITNMLLAVACIYIVMAALFESVLAPTAIITGILFSFVGVWWFFLITATGFTFMAMIGMLVLMGVVVNNGIVLIDHVHRLRESGLSRERALVQGSRDRLRPILMTAATTILGMVPLAVGDTAIAGNGPQYFPMARAIIGGLAFATVVSLIVLPTIYVLLDDLGNWGRRVAARARGREIGALVDSEVAVK
ncbi:MAG: efflux RND transporter permease subunit [Hydrocarboniphaga effusa]|nr:efflux RND transporter permease subunit [Hydrocarboniphaga effusa]